MQVENVVAVVDLQAMQVIAVEDYGVVPLPPEEANYSPAAAGARTDLKPIEIHQPQGPSFAVGGHAVSWQKWQFRVGFTPREGLVLHTVTYTDQGRERPIVYRASLADMVVPYGDPSAGWFFRNSFDAGELEQIFGQPLVVENRPGAATNHATASDVQNQLTFAYP